MQKEKEAKRWTTRWGLQRKCALLVQDVEEGVNRSREERNPAWLWSCLNRQPIKLSEHSSLSALSNLLLYSPAASNIASSDPPTAWVQLYSFNVQSFSCCCQRPISSLFPLPPALVATDPIINLYYHRQVYARNMRHVVDEVGEEGGYACNFMEAQVTGTTIESRMPFPINQLYNPTLALSLFLSVRVLSQTLHCSVLLTKLSL